MCLNDKRRAGAETGVPKFLHSRDVAVGNGSDIGTEVSIKAVIVGYTRQLD